ncbi:MAG: DUF2948 family protein [Flavobacteriaceae bacterium]
MNALKLIALDAEDIDILAAHLQDAVAVVGDLAFLPKQNRFVGMFNRLAREAGAERHRAALRIEGVRSARRSGISQQRADAVLNLLTLRFEPGTAPGGILELVFSGGGVIRLEVDYVEAALADLGAAWSARALPDHDNPPDSGGAA